MPIYMSCKILITDQLSVWGLLARPKVSVHLVVDTARSLVRLVSRCIWVGSLGVRSR